MQTSEQELIARAVAKDADAYGQLVERYKNAIYRHCFAMLRDEDAAEDIAQETFIAAYYKLTTFDKDRKFSTWLFKIATNLSLTALKKSKRTTLIDEEAVNRIVSGHILPSEEAQNAEVHDAIARLEPKYRAVVHLYYFEGLDYSEIAQAMSRPTGSVKGWMNRAKRELRKELA